MRQFRTEAIILRRTNYGEADRILNLLTPEHGKLSAIAKGVRRPKSKLAGGLELFAVCDVTILQGKSDLGVVTSSRIKQFYGDILRDYDRMQVAYEVIKQINKVTETVTDSTFYALLHDSLLYLGDLKIDWRITELWFWLQLANLLGNPINLTTDKSGEPLKETEKYSYDHSSNAFYAHPGGDFGSEHIKFLRLAVSKPASVLSRVNAGQIDLVDLLGLTRGMGRI
jgi:DNA repair protein RecO (recombination protein O)